MPDQTTDRTPAEALAEERQLTEALSKESRRLFAKLKEIADDTCGVGDTCGGWHTELRKWAESALDDHKHIYAESGLTVCLGCGEMHYATGY
jgi:hypothetical protein